MSKTYDFLKQCDFFILTTVNGTVPAARPFGAVMEHDEELYFSTANTKEVYLQLTKNPCIQIIAIKNESRDWVRINGRAIESDDLNLKQAMLDACPVLSTHFDSKECENFALFKVSEMKASLYTTNGVVLLN